jgi:hypothetical protein
MNKEQFQEAKKKELTAISEQVKSHLEKGADESLSPELRLSHLQQIPLLKFRYDVVESQPYLNYPDGGVVPSTKFTGLLDATTNRLF